MLTKKDKKNQRKLPREILGVTLITFVLATMLFFTLNAVTAVIVDHYLYAYDIVLNDGQYAHVYYLRLSLSLIVSVLFFTLLLLFLLGDRLSYIREILDGIDALQNGNNDYQVPLEGNNELTQLAEAVNYLSYSLAEVKEKEKKIQEDKDLFIRAMSHDIRTPLTSIISYSEMMIDNVNLTAEQQNENMKLIQHKAQQIKDMTDILLDGSKRNLERFDDASLLMQQLAGEFEEVLEDRFTVETTFNCPKFSGSFDVQELRRIFDNLISNVQKYADYAKPVKLFVELNDHQLVIKQENSVGKLDATAEGFQIGLRSIQRIVHNYGGHVDIYNDGMVFSISIVLLEI